MIIIPFKGQKSRENSVMIVSYIETTQLFSTINICISLVTMEIKLLFNISACDLNSIK